MSTTTTDEVRWDPYDADLVQDPYPVFKRLRDEAPLYYNAEHDFYALSRYEDVQKALADWSTFISGKGGIIELIRADIEMPSGVFIFEDPPIHTAHRGLLSRVFTPRKMAALEPQIRQYCADCLDKLTGADQFDLIAELGAQMPMRVIGMLLGIPDEDQEMVRDKSDAALRTEAGKPMRVSQEKFATGEIFEEYIDWRAEHPSDDLMTELMNAEFEDEHGVNRTLERDEVLVYTSVIAGAGNETTTRLIGWAGKVLADNPDQRRELVEDPSLIPAAIEEILRFEPPAPHSARVTSKPMEYYGQTVPENSIMVMLMGSANRDDRKYPNGDQFDIHRDAAAHVSFGFGIHHCMGAALARIEGRIALEELLKRFPEWDVDVANAKLSSTSTVRGWESLPITIP